MLVTLSAHIEICQDCKRTGELVLPDGKRSTTFLSKAGAYDSITLARANGFIDEHEEKILKSQIDESPLRNRYHMYELGVLIEFTAPPSEPKPAVH